MRGISLEKTINEEEFKEFIRLVFRPLKRDSLCIFFNGEVMTMGEWWNKFKREENDDITTD